MAQLHFLLQMDSTTPYRTRGKKGLAMKTELMMSNKPSRNTSPHVCINIFVRPALKASSIIGIKSPNTAAFRLFTKGSECNMTDGNIAS
jgi:hypothetical protein